MRKLVIFISLIYCLFNLDCTNPTDSQVTSTYKILVSSYEGPQTNLYIRNLDGSEEINLSLGLIYSCCGQFTPDGTKIVFFSYDSIVVSTVKLYVVEKDGNNLKFLSEFLEPYYVHFSISNTDAIYGKRVGDQQQIYKIDYDTNTETNLSNNSYRDGGPIYSPDRLKIAFGRYHNNTISLNIMNNDGSNQTVVYTFSEPYNESLAKMLFTPDGTRIIFYFDGEIYRINVDGTNLKQITESEGFIDTRNLSISPWGDKIVYNEWEKEEFIAHTYIQNIYSDRRYELIELSDPSWDYIFTPNGTVPSKSINKSKRRFTIVISSPL